MDKFVHSSRPNKIESVCSECKQNITSSNLIICGDCNATYHPICAKVMSSDPTKASDWKCPACRASEPKTTTAASVVLCDRSERPESPSMTATGTRPLKRPALYSPISARDENEDTQPDVATELRLLRRDMAELKSFLVSITEGLTNCNARLDNFDARIQVLEERDTIITTLREEVVQLKTQLNYESQNSLSNELEILGVYESPSENLEHIVMVAATSVGIKLSETDIDSVSRVGTKKPRSTGNETHFSRPIIAKLTRKAKKEELLKAAKARRQGLTSTSLNLPGPACNIYINEHLTKANRMLFRDARIRAKESGFRFCWINKGRVHVRKDEGKSAILLNNLADLDRILPAKDSSNHTQNPAKFTAHTET